MAPAERRRRRSRPSRSRARPARTPGRPRPARTRRSRTRPGRRCGTARRRRCRRARRPPGPQSRASWSRGRTPAEKTTRSVARDGAVGEVHAGDRAGVVGDDLLGADAGVHGQAHALDGAPQRRAAALVDLHGHQPGRELHDVGVQSEALERARRLQAEQSAADDRRRCGRSWRTPRSRAGPRWCGRRSSPRRPCRAPAARTGTSRWPAPACRTRTVRPAREVTVRAARSMASAGSSEVQLDAVPLHEAVLDHGQVVGGAAGEVRGELDPVVGGAGLLAQHDDPRARSVTPRSARASRKRWPTMPWPTSTIVGVDFAGMSEASIIREQVQQGHGVGQGSSPSQARASAPTVARSPSSTPPTSRSPRTTTLRYAPRVASVSWTTSSPGRVGSPNAARSSGPASLCGAGRSRRPVRVRSE